jgi:hypothetical protein
MERPFDISYSTSYDIPLKYALSENIISFFRDDDKCWIDFEINYEYIERTRKDHTA